MLSSRRRSLPPLNRGAALAVVLLGAALVLALAPGAYAASHGAGVVVALERSATSEQVAAAVRAVGGEVIHTVPSTRSLLVATDAGARATLVAKRVSAMPGVRYAEPNRRVHAQFVPNDPMYTLQWGLPAVNAPIAWDGARASSAVKVAVIDSGAYFGHPDLTGILDSMHDYDFVNMDSDASDDNGHGTHVTGIVAAIANNGQGVASLAGLGAQGATGGVRVIPIKVLDENGDGWDEDVALAIRHAADSGARVINLSMGGPGSTPLSEAVAYARAKGCVLVAAAGNSGLDRILYPAGVPGVIGVASLDSELRQAMFSNSGAHVDVSAPGEQVFSTSWPGGAASTGSLYGYMSGTSMATPFVAAEAALLFSTMPNATNAQVESAIMSSARDLGPVGRDDDYGRGLIDAAAALSQLTGYDYSPPVTAASGIPSGWSSRDVTVTLKATDDLSGVATTQVRVGAEDARAYTAPFAVTAEGSTRIAFWSVDRAGNHEDQKTATARIDKTPPTTTSDAVARYVRSATIRFSPVDRLSGVAATRWNLDGAQGSGTVVTTTVRGFHTLTFTSTDGAGNAEPTRAIAFGVVNSADDVLPLTTAALGVPGAWVNTPATITLVSSGSGLSGAGTYYSLDEGPAIAYSSPFMISREGTTTLEFWSSAEGVAELHKLGYVRVDTSPPSVALDALPSYEDVAIVTATASDTVSGITPQSLGWSLDGVGWESGSTAVLDRPGRYAVVFRAFDLAGNEAQATAHVLVTGASAISLAKPAVATPAWGTACTLAGAVSPAPASPATVTIQARVPGTTTWARVATTRTAGGAFSARVLPRRRLEYRAVFSGDDVLRAAAPSNRVTLAPKVSLTPVSGLPASVRKGALLQLSGRVVPQHSASVYLMIERPVERPSGSTWVKSRRIRLALHADGRDGSTWRVALRLPQGRWRVRVYHAADTLHASTYSTARYARVR